MNTSPVRSSFKWPDYKPPSARRANLTLRRLRADKRVAIVDDERRDGGYIIVTLIDGWTIDPLDPHAGVFGGDTLAEIYETLKRAIPFD